MTAGIADLLCCYVPLYEVQRLGPLAWVLSGLCVALIALDLWKKYSLDRGWITALAGGLLPMSCGAAEELLFGQWEGSLAVWTFWGLLLLLQLWVLVRGLWTPWEDAPRTGAEKLLQRGFALGSALWVWPGLFLAGVLVCATFGLLLTVILGALIAQRNALWEYAPGMLVGYAVCWLFQVLYFQRALALARREDAQLDKAGLGFALLVPFWNMVQARKLQMRLRSCGGGKGEREPWEVF